jgi:hypothetical protein
MTKHPEYRGVYARTSPRPSPYFARVNHKGQWLFSSYFKSPESAARAYDRIAASLWGDRATLNFPEQSS